MTTKAHVLRELELWAMRRHGASEQGWSSTSSTERALEMARRGIKTDGAARHRRGVALPMPKETRPTASAVVPPVGFGPDVMDALLLDMDSEGLILECECVRLKALAPKRSTDDLAQYTGTTGRQFRRLRAKGIEWLRVWMGL